MKAKQEMLSVAWNLIEQLGFDDDDEDEEVEMGGYFDVKDGDKDVNAEAKRAESERVSYSTVFVIASYFYKS